MAMAASRTAAQEQATPAGVILGAGLLSSLSAARHVSGESKLLREFAASGLSVCCANVVLNPVEVIKTRMMLASSRPAAAESAAAAAAVAASSSSSSTSGPTQRRLGFAATARQVVQQEGTGALARGIQASAARAVFNGGIRLGLYGPIKALLSQDGQGSNLSMAQKVLAGSVSGGIGALLTSPMELVKTQLQAPNRTVQGPGEVIRRAVQQHGLRGLWLGATPGVLRVTLLNASMCSTYDELKGKVGRYTGWAGSSLKTQLAASMIAGVVTTTVINPADVVRAYIQTGRGRGVLAVAADIWRSEGPAAFMKGWTAAYARTGPQTMIIFMVSETVRPMFGLNNI